MVHPLLRVLVIVVATWVVVVVVVVITGVEAVVVMVVIVVVGVMVVGIITMTVEEVMVVGATTMMVADMMGGVEAIEIVHMVVIKEGMMVVMARFLHLSSHLMAVLGETIHHHLMLMVGMKIMEWKQFLHQ